MSRRSWDLGEGPCTWVSPVVAPGCPTEDTRERRDRHDDRAAAACGVELVRFGSSIPPEVSAPYSSPTTSNRGPHGRSDTVSGMDGPSRSRARSGSPGVLFFVLAVSAGLFAMHGLQATAGPTPPAGIAVMAWMTSMDSPPSGAERPRLDRSPAHDHPGHGHPGGQMCLGLLVMFSLLILSALLIDRSAWLRVPGVMAARRGARNGREPPAPSVFQLSVLRL